MAEKDIFADDVLAKHGPWVQQLKQQYTFTEENAMEILLEETGKAFSQVLEDAGVYKGDAQGRAAFRKFVAAVNEELGG